MKKKVLVIILFILTVKLVAEDNFDKAYFAGGCFWGVEYYLEQLEGVIYVESGYMGGELENPTYRDVLAGDSGHYESVEVLYDPTKISFYDLTKYFFEIHDPTQKDGQGPDIGSQYLSAIFVKNQDEKDIVIELIKLLESYGYDVATKVFDISTFYKAENYHQDYYEKTGKLPYCHKYIKRFKD